MKVSVVTPTIGSQHLEQCLLSVKNQVSNDEIYHYIFIDGKDYFDKVLEIIDKVDNKNVRVVALDKNVGSGWYGHRVYAACSFLVEGDLIVYLDEDNFIEENHVQSMTKEIDKGSDWCFSLRNIVDFNGNFVCEDNCESLGLWPVYTNENQYHVDTSCFGVRRDVALRIGHAWYGQWGADRQFYGALREFFKNFSCTKKYTLNYRVEGNPRSVDKKFFEVGNQKQYEKYDGDFPWKSEDPKDTRIFKYAN